MTLIYLWQTFKLKEKVHKKKILILIFIGNYIFICTFRFIRFLYAVLRNNCCTPLIDLKPFPMNFWNFFFTYLIEYQESPNQIINKKVKEFCTLLLWPFIFLQTFFSDFYFLPSIQHFNQTWLETKYYHNDPKQSDTDSRKTDLRTQTIRQSDRQSDHQTDNQTIRQTIRPSDR